MTHLSPTEAQLFLLEKYLTQFWKDIKDEHLEQINTKGESDFINVKFIERNINDPLNQKRGEWFNLIPKYLKIDKGFPKLHFNDRNRISFIQLREANSSLTHLVLGCGNNPAWRGMYVPENSYSDVELDKLKQSCLLSYSDKSFGESVWYNRFLPEYHFQTHLHTDAITCDPDVSMNPTFIGFAFIEKRPLPLPDNHFTKIECEGIDLSRLSGYEIETKRLRRSQYNSLEISKKLMKERDDYVLELINIL